MASSTPRRAKDKPRSSRDIILRPYQEDAYQRMERLGGYIAGLADMRAGKTVLTLKFIHDHDLSAFIFLPGWVANVWYAHVREKGFPFDDYEFYMFNKGRLDDRAALVRRLCVPNKRWIAVFNNEAMWQDPLDEAIVRAAVKSGAYTGVDEAHSIAKRNSRQSKFAGRLGGRPVAARVPLTGTPTSKNLEDYWSLFRYADPRVFGTRYKTFEDRYVIKGGYFGYQVVGYRETDDLKRRIADHSFQITRQQAGILDPEEVPIRVKLSSKAQDYYKQFQEEAYLRLKGLREDGTRERRELIAKRKIIEMLRLQQLASGIVGTPKEGYIYVDGAKLKAVLGIAESYLAQHRKPVIVCRFLPEIWRICHYFKMELHRTFSGYAGDGDKGLRQRTQNLKDFASGELPILVCQIHAIARGQDLSMADCTIFMSAGVGLRTFQQAAARDLGDDYVPQHYHIIADNTIDELIYENFGRDQEAAALVSNLSYTRRTLSLM